MRAEANVKEGTIRFDGQTVPVNEFEEWFVREFPTAINEYNTKTEKDRVHIDWYHLMHTPYFLLFTLFKNSNFTK